MNSESIPAGGEAGERWEDVGMNRKNLPTGEVGDRSKNVGISRESIQTRT